MKTLTSRQLTTLIVIILTGSGFIAMQAVTAGTMSVPAVAAAALLALPFYAVYESLSRNTGLDMYGLYELCFGRAAGGALTVLYVLFTGATAALAIFDASAYLHVVALPETSVYIIAAAALLVASYISRKGFEAMGYVGRGIFIVCVAVVGLVMLMSLTKTDFDNMDFASAPDGGTFLRATLLTAALPFLTGGLLVNTAAHLPEEQRTGRPFLKALIIACVIMLLVSASTLLILGSPVQEKLRYPFFAAMSLGVVGDFISHIEVLVSAVALAFSVIKCAVNLRVSADGAQRLFLRGKSFDMSLPLAAGFMLAGMAVFRNYSDIERYTLWWCVAAAVFYALLPAVLLIVVKLKRAARTTDKTHSRGNGTRR